MQLNSFSNHSDMIRQLEKEVEETLSELDYIENFMWGTKHVGMLSYSTASWTKTNNPTDFFYGNPDTDEPYAIRAQEITKYSLLSNRPEKQIEYELRSIGL